MTLLALRDEPPKSDGVVHKDGEMQIWMLGESLDNIANARLHKIDKRKATNPTSSLRKYWKNIEVEPMDHFTALKSFQ